MPTIEQLPSILAEIIAEVNNDLTAEGATLANAPELLRDRMIAVKTLADAFGAECPDVASLPQA
jgi:hypothetical protein